MPKALVFSDLHIHAHKGRIDRLEDCLEVLRWVFDQSKEHKCEYILFLGDIFHDRAKIDVLVYQETFETIVKHMKDNDQQMYLLVGNHDMYHRERWDVTSVKPFNAISNVHIVDEPSTIEIGGRKIDFMPHTENPIKDLEELKKGRTKEETTLLLGHMAVNGAILNTMYGTMADVIVEYDTGMIPVDVDIFNAWDRTFLGHYHGAQKLNEKAEYIGSPLQLSFGEAFQKKHIAVLDLKDLKTEYIENTFSPKHYILDKSELEDYDLKGSFTRIECSGEVSNQDIIDIKLDLMNKDVASVTFNNKERKKEKDEEEIQEARAILYKQGEMLEKWLQEAKIPEGLDKTKLLEIGKKIIEEDEN